MELATAAKELQSPLDLVRGVAEAGKLPVVLFCAGGIATPADASLVMQLGAEGVFVGSGIFKSEDPATRAAAIVEATTHYQDPDRVARASEGLGMAMQSLETRKLEEGQLLANRGWYRGPRPPGRLRSALQDVAGPRRRRARGPRARRSRRARRARDARRRVDDDDARDQARGARGPAAGRSCRPASPSWAPAPG